MRYFFTLVFFQLIFLTAHQSLGMTVASVVMKDVETEFIVIEFPKYEKYKIQLLLTELNTYQGKISDARFDFVSQRMSIYYYSTIKLDDIFQLVGAYQMDFNKIEGSEL